MDLLFRIRSNGFAMTLSRSLRFLSSSRSLPDAMDLKYFLRRSKVLRRYRSLLGAARLLQSDEIREQIRCDFRANKDAKDAGVHLAFAQTELHKLQALVATVGPRGPILAARVAVAEMADSSDELSDEEGGPSAVGEGWPWER